MARSGNIFVTLGANKNSIYEDVFLIHAQVKVLDPENFYLWENKDISGCSSNC